MNHRTTTLTDSDVKKDVALLARRQEIYERTGAQHPHRWYVMQLFFASPPKQT